MPCITKPSKTDSCVEIKFCKHKICVHQECSNWGREVRVSELSKEAGDVEPGQETVEPDTKPGKEAVSG